MPKYKTRVFSTAQQLPQSGGSTEEMWQVDLFLGQAAREGWEPHLMAYSAGGQLVFVMRSESN